MVTAACFSRLKSTSGILSLAFKRIVVPTSTNRIVLIIRMPSGDLVSEDLVPEGRIGARTIVVKYVKKSAQNTAYSMFERNTCEYVKSPINRPEKIEFRPC